MVRKRISRLICIGIMFSSRWGNILCSHAPDIKSLNVDSILRSGIRRYPQEVGVLWNMLAEYYTRCSLFEKAYDVYEEAINTVTTVRGT